MAEKDGGMVSLVLYFVFWYLGNYYYNIYNKTALNETGGKHAGFAMTVSTMQLAVCSVYALTLWLIRLNPITLLGLNAPAKQNPPDVKGSDLPKMGIVSFCSAGAHSASVFALNAGSVTFGQIVKAGEPVFAAAVNTIFYAKPPTFFKTLCLPVIVGGVAFACMKPDPTTGAYSLDFDIAALTAGCIANCMAAFKGSENKKLMEDADLKIRIGGVGNQFAITEIYAFLISVPVMFYLEGAKFGDFVKIFQSNQKLQFNLIMSGLTFYWYNELATMTIKKTGALTSSVANTAKRVIVIVGVAIAMNKPLTFEEKVGAGVAVAGVLLYSVIDDLFKKKTQ